MESQPTQDRSVEFAYRLMLEGKYSQHDLDMFRELFMSGKPLGSLTQAGESWLLDQQLFLTTQMLPEEYEQEYQRATWQEWDAYYRAIRSVEDLDDSDPVYQSTKLAAFRIVNRVCLAVFIAVFNSYRSRNSIPYMPVERFGNGAN